MYVDGPAHRHAHAQRRRNARRLNRIELAHPPGHEKAFEEPENTRNSGPEEAAVENTQASAA